MLIGYARVSKGDTPNGKNSQSGKNSQNTSLQLKAFKEAGVEKVFNEQASGGRWDRPELHRMLDQLREGDVVVAWKLDRVSRSLKDLLTILEKIEAAGAGFRSLTEPVDTTTPAGRMMMQMVGAFAEFERSIIRERTIAGLEAAKDRGETLGRPKQVSEEQRQDIIENVRSGRKTQAEMARLYKVSGATVSRIVNGAG